jgi:lipoyl(octanoyl) transferase
VLATPPGSLHRADGRPVEWRVTPGLVPYEEAVRLMEARVEAIRAGTASELVWLLEHPALYTAGTGAGAALPQHLPLPLHESGRGGQVTYHGPGQRIAYVLLDLAQRGPDVRRFVAALEGWLTEALATFGVAAERRDDRVGLWVRRPDKTAGLDGTGAEDKIAAIGIRVRRWVTFHGIALNVEPDLAPYAAITPCGIAERHFGVTSLRDLGHPATLAQVDAALHDAFAASFGPTATMPGAP